MNPFLNRVNSSDIGRSGKRSEKRLIKSLGAQATPASGAMAGAKGDFKKHQFLGEAKSTISDSMKLDMNWLLKISHEATQCGKTPLVVISFVDREGALRMRRNSEWVLLPRITFDEMVEDS